MEYKLTISLWLDKDIYVDKSLFGRETEDFIEDGDCFVFYFSKDEEVLNWLDTCYRGFKPKDYLIEDVKEMFSSIKSQFIKYSNSTSFNTIYSGLAGNHEGTSITIEKGVEYMTAKEMFETLGYGQQILETSQSKKYEYIIYYKGEIDQAFCFCNEFQTYWTAMYQDLFSETYSCVFPIDKEEHQAITQQMKELGWI
jgi:hypothetical protein